MANATMESIDTKCCGKIQVYIMGSLRSGSYILTLHDLGCNENEMINFVQHGAMDLLVNRITWIHAVVPGQGDGDPYLGDSYRFPTMQMLAEGLSEVCDTLGLKQIVVFGEGAGANILARLAMMRNDLVIGAVLIHCTGTTAGLTESVRDKIIGWKLNTVGMNPYAESYLLFHRFGTVSASANEAELTQSLTLFRKSLRDSINPKNLNKFITSFMARTKIIEKVNQLKCPVMFLTGTLASHNHTVYRLYNALLASVRDKPEMLTKVDLVQIEGVANVMKEAPEKVAECLQLFIQGLGLAGCVINRRMSTTIPQGGRSRSLSMEEYDQPKGVAVCVYDKNRKYSSAFNEGDEVKQELQSQH